jgi:hypothetical protein
MYNFTRTDIDLEAIRGRIARMSDRELRKYGEAAAWMARTTPARPGACSSRKPDPNGAAGTASSLSAAREYEVKL